jgi:UDP-N-acetylglucosamine 2-epimerase (non-hydrolysing)
VALRILNAVGTRPNLVKMAAMYRAYAARPGIEPVLVHTGQHSSHEMNGRLFEELELPAPEVVLEAGGDTNGRRFTGMVEGFREACRRYRPDVVVVVGDVDSTIACASAAAGLRIPLAHVEAGLRSRDPDMPEERNRIETDLLSDLLFASEGSGVENLAAEGIDPTRVRLVGNVMIDTLRACQARAARSCIRERLGVREREYAVLTLHRPANVDDAGVLGGILNAVREVARERTVVFPAHPRTRLRIREHGLDDLVGGIAGLRLIDPPGYLDFLWLMTGAAVVMTDSGGVQEETTVLGVPCVTLRDNTERPVTCELGTNRLAGTRCDAILRAVREALLAGRRPAPVIPLWDGRAAGRVADALLAFGHGALPSRR